KIAPWRYLAFVAVFAIATPIAVDRLHTLALGLMAGFDIAAVLFLIVVMPLFRTRDAAEVRQHATENDANRTGLLILTAIVMAVLLASIGAETAVHHPEPLTKTLVIVTLFLAWLFSNLVYAFHYIHLAYRAGTMEKSCGLDFPGTEEPLY